jgi:histidinol dehydrogenase
MTTILRRCSVAEVQARPRVPVDPATAAVAARIVEDVREGGEAALRRHAEQLGDLPPGAPLWLDRERLLAARDALPTPSRRLLERTADRIRAFASAQCAGLQALEIAVPGGRAGHRWLPVQAVGAYAPGGRHPLPSSVLMTVIPARVAGAGTVVVASPRPAPITLAAAAIAGAEQVLAVGGAQAIAALAFGLGGPAVDVIVGPGNRFVTAAKKHLVGEVGIDGLAGPSELLVVADASADPRLVAADLLAQAEHDEDAVPMLVTTDAALPAAVDGELARQLVDLPTAGTAAAALRRNGFVVLVPDLRTAVAIANRLAPEHLELCVHDPEAIAPHCTAYGSLFLGSRSAEVFGDYGLGPNHVLPTGGGARFQAGLSVFTFLRASTWSRVDDAAAIAGDAAALARLEGLEAHARAAERRVSPRPIA